jgi:hypothetical protein
MAPPHEPLELDDKHIVGGSPIDRVIGMLLERIEAVRELHESMRTEFRQQIDTHAELKVMIAKLTERAEAHERNDTASFIAVNNAITNLGTEVKNLAALVTQATTAGLIQKAQFTAGWKVLTVIAAVFFAIMGIFFGFFNHPWPHP